MVKKIPNSVAAYYKKQSGVAAETLLEMRKRILEVSPKAEEIIKYGMPTFVLDGNEICGLLVNKGHLGYYPYSGSVLTKAPEITKKYKTTKGSLHIPFGQPLPKSAISKLIKLRISQCPVAKGEVDLSKYEKLDGEWRELKLAAPARRALINAKISKITQLSKISESELKKLHGMGPNALKVIKAEMKKRRLKFKSER